MDAVRVNWQLKAILPVVLVLLAGLLLLTVATVTFRDPERHAVLILAGAGAVIICLVSIVALAYLIQRPMVELQEKVALISEGNLDVSVSFAQRNDEIGDLGRNFNHMKQQLRESRKEIETMHRTQMSRAEHLATLGELATGLAHEIRNPLAGIAGVMEIVGRDLPADSPAIGVLGEVRHEVVHINKIVTELLEIARPKPPVFRLGDVVSVAEHAALFARDQASVRRVRLEVLRGQDIPQLEFDSGQIHQVLLNLLLNAVQACEAGDSVQVEFTGDAHYVVISVTDTGKGIPADVLPNIFRPFFTTKGNGTGLGLSLARRIVEEHGGWLEATSELGRGTQFRLSLPKTREEG